MGKFIFLRKNQLNGLPKTAGVYSFISNKELLYIGKARSIRERVKNHFQQPNFKDNLFLEKIEKIGCVQTNSEIEALILEAKLIKKYQPKFNVIWKDDKNYFYVEITKEKLPRVSITHQPQPQKPSKTRVKHIGPFVDGTALKKTLRLLREVFPYYTTKNHLLKPCLWCHLNLCPGPSPDLKEYKKNIKNLIAVLGGKKQEVLRSLKKEMKKYSQDRNFERAAIIRDQVFALEKTMSHAKVFEFLKFGKDNWEKTQNILKGLLKIGKPISRIEGYDISNIQGKEASASMVVFINGKPAKRLYRKFKIRISGKPNDTAMIKETLNRRISHNEWPLPDIILVDGGKPQLNAVLKMKTGNVKIMALAKKKNELYVNGKNKPILLKTLPREVFNLILQIRDESHCFALAYHKKLRERRVLNTS